MLVHDIDCYQVVVVIEGRDIVLFVGQRILVACYATI